MEYRIKKIEVIESKTNYFVDTEGNIFSSFGCKNGELKKLKPKLDRYGYYTIGLRDMNGKKNHFTVHRLVALHFIDNDNPQEKTTVNHINNIKTDNRVENLEWMSQADNNRYRFKMGFKVDGSVRTIFDKNDAKDILILFYKDNVSRINIKKKYNDKYTRQSIENLLNNKIKCFNYLFEELNIPQEEIARRRGFVDEYRKQEVYNALYEYFAENVNKKEICEKYNMSRDMLNSYLIGDRLGFIIEQVKKDLNIS